MFVQSWGQTQQGRWLAKVVFALLVLASLWQCWEIWRIAHKHAHLRQQVLILPTPKQLQQHIDDPGHWQLFDEFIPDTLQQKAIPESRANIRLLGIMLAKPLAKSQAIIDIGGGREKIYRKGEKLPDGSKVYRILPDGMLIMRKGRLESLSLPDDALEFEPPAQPLPMQKQ